MYLDWLLYGLMIAGAILVVVAIPHRKGWLSLRTVLVSLTGLLLFSSVLALQQMVWNSNVITASEAVPPRRIDGLFAGSTTCRSCHAKQYDTWHSSFHRTMTQVATPESVVAPFDDILLEKYNQTVQLIRREDEFRVRMDDPAIVLAMARAGKKPPATGLPQVEKQIVMTTGSHNFQAYWYAANDEGELWQFPWRYNIAEGIWMHRDDVFLQPPVDRPALGHQVWNATCINCHSVGGQPGLDRSRGRFSKTRIAELGISCEACHGPCASHVAENKNPVRRYQYHLSGKQDPTVFNHDQHSQQMSLQACGACHSHYEYHDANPLNNDNIVTGREHRPGQDMRERARFMTVADEGVFSDGSTQISVSRFWADGSCRSGGREYNGVIESRCCLQGNMTCTSCHTMHGNDPAAQLKPGMNTNHACVQCHSDIGNAVAEHTHHAADSSGSECMNCHMPYTSFALLKGIRSHYIDSPAVASFGKNVRLNACNLCHLDRTLAWTADNLRGWYGSESPDLTDEEKQVSASLLWLLRGDAGQRVISAWHFGWKPSQAVSGTNWMKPFLGELFRDPYAAVRFNAAGALESKDSKHRKELLKIAVDASMDEREKLAARIISEWLKEKTISDSPHRNTVKYERHKHLIDQRDDRSMVIVE
jgi:predicted CXXCH cytochrome family protein